MIRSVGFVSRRGAVLLGLGVLVSAGPAHALTGVEGVALGDQGYYWDTGSEVWILPHRLANIDNEVFLQVHAGAGARPLTPGELLLGDPRHALYNLEPQQSGPGAGAV